MADKDVHLTHRALDAMNRRDLEAFLELMDERVEAVSRIVAIEGGLYGHDGIRLWWENWFNAFPDYEIEILEIRDLDDGRTLAALRALGHGAGSDLPFEDTVWLGGRWRNGKCVWWRVFYTLDEGLETTQALE